MIFNEKAVVNFSRIFNSKVLPWNPYVKFRSQFFLVNVSKIVCLIYLVLNVS